MFAFARTGVKILLLAAGTAGFVALGAGIAAADEPTSSLGLNGPSTDAGQVVPLVAGAPDQVVDTVPNEVQWQGTGGAQRSIAVPRTEPVLRNAGDRLAGAVPQDGLLAVVPETAPVTDKVHQAGGTAKDTVGKAGGTVRGLDGAAENPQGAVQPLRDRVDGAAPADVTDRLPAGDAQPETLPQRSSLPQDPAGQVGDAVGTVRDTANGDDVHHQSGKAADVEADPSTKETVGTVVDGLRTSDVTVID